MLIATSTATNVIFALGAAIVSFFLIRRSRRYLANVQRPAPFSSHLKPRSLPEAAIAASTELEVQFHDRSREIMAQLDSKMSALQALIRLADETATRLEAAVERAHRLGLDARRDTLEDLANLSTASIEDAQRLLNDLTDPSRKSLPVDEHYALQVLELARAGRSSESIANELGVPQGDVEMILSLNGK